MANSYYNNTTNTISNGTLAEASDVEDKCNDIAAGFDGVESDIADVLTISAGDIASRDIADLAATRANKAIGFDASGALTLHVRKGTYKGDWVTATYYAQDDTVKDTAGAAGFGVDAILVCTISHTSTTLPADIANWDTFIDTSDLEQAVTDAETAETNAAASAAAASTSETNAAASESAASTSETNAAASETACAAYAAVWQAKNKLINGNMRLAQRQQSYSGGVGYHTLDRWYHGNNDMQVVRQQDATTGDFYVEINRTVSGQTTCWIGQGIELPSVGDCGEFAIGTTWTLGYDIFVPSGVDADAYVNLTFFDATSGGNPVIPESGHTGRTSVTSGSWQSVSTTITVDTSPSATNSVLRVLVGVVLNSGTLLVADKIKIRNVQFEKGSLVTDFEVEDRAIQRLKAERYYRTSYGYGFYPGDTSTVNMVNTITRAHTYQGVTVSFIGMRTTPTITLYNPITGTSGSVSYLSAGSGEAVAGAISAKGFSEITTSTVTPAAGDLLRFHYEADAEI